MPSQLSSNSFIYSSSAFWVHRELRMSKVPSPIMFDRLRAQPHQRLHRKSRLGCKVCKSRKIKCDEVRPVCGNCYRRFPNAEEECEFDPVSPKSGRSPTPTSGPRQVTPGSSIGIGPSSSIPTSRSMELRLFHHYSTVTCRTMPTCEEPAGLNMWANTIPSLAFECPYIYSAILGIASLHLLTLSPDDIALKAATYQYIDETVSAHKEEMSSIESSNPLNRFTTSVLVTIHSKLRSRYEKYNGVPYTLPTNYFILQNGAKDLFNQTDEWNSEVKAYISCYSEVPGTSPLTFMSYTGEPAPSTLPRIHDHTYTNQEFPYDPLPSFVEFDNSITPDRKRVYTQALAYVSLIKDSIIRGEKSSWIQHRLGIVPSFVGKEFCVLMQEEDPLSLVILARFFALSKFVDKPWWLQGTATYEVKGLETLVPEEWKWGIEWPLEILRM